MVTKHDLRVIAQQSRTPVRAGTISKPHCCTGGIHLCLYKSIASSLSGPKIKSPIMNISRLFRSAFNQLCASPAQPSLNQPDPEPSFVKATLNQDECLICLRKFEERREIPIIFLCGHAFGYRCFSRWQRANREKHRCAICNADLYYVPPPTPHDPVDEHTSARPTNNSPPTDQRAGRGWQDSLKIFWMFVGGYAWFFPG